ncbi:MAG: hypothetical protein B6245_02570 [Desulfobacteraceae bacterium 4572_88]|nr:MAG: hypothetical protein B6245_02570 [Desulfobacteraceae bacterium 4572_88]
MPAFILIFWRVPSLTATPYFKHQVQIENRFRIRHQVRIKNKFRIRQQVRINNFLPQGSGGFR